jgi:hypothetical protein
MEEEDVYYMTQPKLKLRGKKHYKNTHGTVCRVKSRPKPNYKKIKKALQMQLLKAQASNQASA